MSGSNSSSGDMPQNYREILDNISEGEDMASDFEEEAYTDSSLLLEAEVEEAVVEQVVEGDDAFHLAEDVAFDIGNNPVVVYLNDEGRIVPLEEPMNVYVMDHPAEGPLVERPVDPKVESGCNGGGKHDGSELDGIGIQVDPDLSDEEWKKGDRLVGVYVTDEDIPVQLREHLVTHGRGRATMRRANGDDVNEERVDGERSDNGVMIDDDIMKEYERFCKSDAARFEWKSMASFQGVKELFQVDRTGPTRVFQNAYDAFREYWDDAVLQHIADATNIYGDAVPEAEKTFHKYWYHTNAHEILILFAFWMMLGVVKMPSIKSCFSNDVLLKTNVYRMMFTEGRYWSLNRALRFAPNETAEQNPDKMRHLRPILTHLNRKFKECYIPSQDICIDESLSLWRAQLSFCQNTRTKAAKFEIKNYELCESATGYLWSFFLCTGKSSDRELSAVKKTGTVLKLIRPLLGKGYQLFIDNFFNSPLLARFLKRKQTDYVGTLKRNRKHIPPLISIQKPRPGSYMARHAGDVVLLSQTDRNPLVMISTHHGTEQFQTRERLGHPSEYKFVAVTDYNIGMGGIHKKDQMLEPYLVEGKPCKWWFKKCFKRLLNVTILNSRVLVKKSGGDSVQLVFRMELVRDILQKHVHLLPRPHRATSVRADNGIPPNQIVCDESRFHAIKKINQPDERRRKGTNRIAGVQCRWCRDREHKRGRTSYECSLCKVPLCIEPCFTRFHTQL